MSRFWEVVDKHKVNIFYTAPTAIRSLMGAGEGPVKQTSRASLRLLGSVGEPINPEAWEWYHRVVGDERCPIVDTWWQTETGGILITPLPGATALKPGSATLPFFGVRPEVVDANGTVLTGACEGNLVIANSWPGQMRTVYGDHERFMQTYFATYPGKYFTGDGCRRDADGYYWITGRVDDVINVSGHRMGTAEVESALVAHQKVSEAAVVGFPHDIKGQGIYAYVTLMTDAEPSGELRKELARQPSIELGSGGGRVGAEVVAKKWARPGPASRYEALARARAEGTDVLLIDRRGRLQEQVGPHGRAARRCASKKVDEVAPQSVILVLTPPWTERAEPGADLQGYRRRDELRRDEARRHCAWAGILVAIAERFKSPINADRHWRRDR